MRQVVDRAQMLFLLANHHLFFGNLITVHFPIFFTKSTFSYLPPPPSKHAIYKTNKIYVYFKRNAISPANSPITATHMDSGVIRARGIKKRLLNKQWQRIKNNRHAQYEMRRDARFDNKQAS